MKRHVLVMSVIIILAFNVLTILFLFNPNWSYGSTSYHDDNKFDTPEALNSITIYDDAIYAIEGMYKLKNYSLVKYDLDGIQQWKYPISSNYNGSVKLLGVFNEKIYIDSSFNAVYPETDEFLPTTIEIYDLDGEYVENLELPEFIPRNSFQVSHEIITQKDTILIIRKMTPSDLNSIGNAEFDLYLYDPEIKGFLDYYSPTDIFNPNLSYNKQKNVNQLVISGLKLLSNQVGYLSLTISDNSIEVSEFIPFADPFAGNIILSANGQMFQYKVFIDGFPTRTYINLTQVDTGESHIIDTRWSQIVYSSKVIGNYLLLYGSYNNDTLTYLNAGPFLYSIRLDNDHISEEQFTFTNTSYSGSITDIDMTDNELVVSYSYGERYSYSTTETHNVETYQIRQSNGIFLDTIPPIFQGNLLGILFSGIYAIYQIRKASNKSTSSQLDYPQIDE